MYYSAVGIRYSKIWDEYLSGLTKDPHLQIRSLLRKHNVGFHCYENWMSRNGHSIRQAKAHAASLQPESITKETAIVSETSFVPVVVHEESCVESHSCDVLTGISLTLPDGTVITIRRDSAEAVVSFLKLYSGEGTPCSD